MDTQGDAYDINLVNGRNILNHEFTTERKAEKERPNKRKRKDGGNDGTSSLIVALLEDMREERRAMNEVKKEMFEKTYLQEEEKLKQNAEMILLKRWKLEARIMSMETSGMPPLQAQYIRRRQMEILAKKT